MIVVRMPQQAGDSLRGRAEGRRPEVQLAVLVDTEMVPTSSPHPDPNAPTLSKPETPGGCRRKKFHRPDVLPLTPT